jgi:hypothetical protein
MRAVAHSALLFLAVFDLTACRREAASDTPRETPAAARITVADFGRLRWLEGRWRGEGSEGPPFFEAYHFMDDSTIQSYTYADSTFASASDSGMIRLRGDTVTSGWPAPQYVTTALDSTSVHFAALPGAANDFSWHYTGPGAWTARLTWDSAGVARERIYEMRAIP